MFACTPPNNPNQCDVVNLDVLRIWNKICKVREARVISPRAKQMGKKRMKETIATPRA